MFDYEDKLYSVVSPIFYNFKHPNATEMPQAVLC